MKESIMVVKDTVRVVDTLFLNDNSGTIEIYKEIITSQQQTYNLLITVVLAILALFAGATWLYNKKIAGDTIREETEKIFNQQKVKLIQEFKNENDKELNRLKAESSRLFAIQCDEEDIGGLVNALHWWTNCIKYYKLSNVGEGVANSTREAIRVLDKATVKKLDFKKSFNLKYSDTENNIESVYEKVKSISGELTDEKKEIKRKLDEIFKS